MKKILSLVALAMGITHVASAQSSDPNYIGRLPCQNAKADIEKVHFIDIKKGGKGYLNLEVNWGGKNGGSTFAPQNLNITNGSCQTCKPVGQIGANNPKQTWVIKVNDVNKPVTITWQTKGTTDMCGTAVAKIATKDLQ